MSLLICPELLLLVNYFKIKQEIKRLKVSHLFQVIACCKLSV